MRPEAILWKKLRPFFLAAKLDPVRVENPVHPGTPDVNCVFGWIELKTIERWPSRAEASVTLRWYTPQQRVWLFRRWKYAPGTAFLLLEVRASKQCLLFDGDVAAKIVGRATTAGHRANARAVISVHELAELPKILAEIKAPAVSTSNALPLACTGTLVHDEFTRCPVHD